jgi:hypothetical protein
LLLLLLLLLAMEVLLEQQMEELELTLNFIILNVLPSHLMEFMLSLLMRITILFVKLS